VAINVKTELSVSWKLDCKKYILIIKENKRYIKIKVLSNLKRLGKTGIRMFGGLVLLVFYKKNINFTKAHYKKLQT